MVNTLLITPTRLHLCSRQTNGCRLRLEEVRMVMNTKVVQLHGADGDNMNVTALVVEPEVTSGHEAGAVPVLVGQVYALKYAVVKSSCSSGSTSVRLWSTRAIAIAVDPETVGANLLFAVAPQVASSNL
jgi:hypothetical protein